MSPDPTEPAGGAGPAGAPGASAEVGCPLFRHYPRLAERLPHIPLASTPTPVERLELAGRELWVKRDDLTSATYGGNKVRKLEFLLGLARAVGARRLLTVGATGSHHALATTVHGRAHGFEVSLVLFPQPLTDHVREVLLTDAAFGAELRWTDRMATVPVALARARLAYRKERLFTIPAGGSDAVGTLGYVSGALELAEQVEAGLAPSPDEIYLAGGTLGTAAGVALGLTMAGIEARVVAPRITSKLVTNRRALGRLIRGAARVLQEAGVDPPPTRAVLARVSLEEGYIGEGYGRPTAAGVEAAEKCAAAGLTLDPTYTAKAAAALLDQTRDDGRVRLFWHTLSGCMPPLPAGTGDPVDELPEPFRRYLDGG